MLENDPKMDVIELERLMVSELSPLGIQLVPEYGGYSLYDRMLPEGNQLLINAHSLEALWPVIFERCRLERKP